MEAPSLGPSESLLTKLAAGHQEVDRIMDEVEAIYHSQPTEWLVVEPIGSMVCHLWYEDEDEFEDAVGGSFEEFLRVLPHVKLRENAQGKAEFKILKPNPDSKPLVLTLHIQGRSDLWRVLFKAPDARIEIPHLEFEVGQSNKRQIDTVYNHITNAVWNLSAHVRGRTDLSEEYINAVSDTIGQLNELLDVEKPFEFCVHDPTGFSVFKPSDGVVEEVLGGADLKLQEDLDIQKLVADAEDAD
eukprot:CAMPEP_0183382406 /NCGR_PEP_ID=MMETSP0164_2-20130417/126929_1 /TAXON_ID=221442 /ORGANISM="Coccolithus pelagicus ssp braarudi, Strain PLY182g" /LENGTH=242 /DNA_ID=CAMNT_0025560027 /DNA_START=35 /DNA_END=763 /DNA_ORIENTATION=-